VQIIPILGAIALGAQRMFPMLQQVYSSWSRIRGNKEILVDTLTLLDQPISIKEEALNKIDFKKRIILKNISFKYSSVGDLILNNISMSIDKGTIVGFVGETGGGKSTLLDIIVGLLPVKEGALLVDDVVIDDLNRSSWFPHISYVPQNIFLADTSIAENIAFGIPIEDIDMERVRLSAINAHIDGVIEKLPAQYMTSVGEHGVRLSGGQRQRIGIARALYKTGTDILVFDEATSALDHETEKAVMRSIQNLSNQYTVLLIAHRTTTLKNCNKIIQINDGKVIRTGTYDEIIF